jgi:hypothetical protein
MESPMTIRFVEEDNGKLLVIHVGGWLVKTNCEQFVPAFERLIQQNGMTETCA